MADLDPYYEWLGIPPKDQPAHHYRLLGLELYEEHLSAIDAAANRVMAYLQELSNGEEAELAQKILNEVSAARVCLLNTKRKVSYDRTLKAKLGQASRKTRSSGPPTPPPLPVATPLEDQAAAPPAVPGSEDRPDADGVPQISTKSVSAGSPSAVSRRSSRRPKQNEKKMLFAVIAVLLAIVVMLGLFYLWKSGDGKTTARKPAGKGSSNRPEPVTKETITYQARDIARSIARKNRFTNPEIVEVTVIADLLVSPYWKQLADKKKEEQYEFYTFTGEQALQLLNDGHGLTDHELDFRKQQRSGNQRSPAAENNERFNQYLERLRQEAHQDYRDKYTTDFDQQARKLLNSKEE